MKLIEKLWSKIFPAPIDMRFYYPMDQTVRSLEVRTDTRKVESLYVCEEFDHRTNPDLRYIVYRLADLLMANNLIKIKTEKNFENVYRDTVRYTAIIDVVKPKQPAIEPEIKE